MIRKILCVNITIDLNFLIFYWSNSQLPNVYILWKFKFIFRGIGF